MIPDEAVEAAAEVIRRVHYPDYTPDLKFAREVLEAAAPALMAQAWDRAVASMIYEDGSPVELAHNNNPYRTAP